MDAMVPDEVTRRILASYEAADLISTCAWCEKVAFDEEWMLLPRAALAAIDQKHSLSHGICPSCSAVMTRASRMLRARR
jgi:hypothetical protein